GLSGVYDDVQQRLLHQIDIYLRPQRLRADPGLEMNSLPLAVWFCHKRNLFDKRTQISLSQLQLDRTRKVDQSLHHAVEPLNLCVNNIQVSLRVHVRLIELVAQNLQMHNDRIDRILHLVSYSGSEFSDVGHATGNFDFALYLAD